MLFFIHFNWLFFFLIISFLLLNRFNIRRIVVFGFLANLGWISIGILFSLFFFLFFFFFFLSYKSWFRNFCFRFFWMILFFWRHNNINCVIIESKFRGFFPLFAHIYLHFSRLLEIFNWNCFSQKFVMVDKILIPDFKNYFLLITENEFQVFLEFAGIFFTSFCSCWKTSNFSNNKRLIWTESITRFF